MPTLDRVEEEMYSHEHLWRSSSYLLNTSIERELESHHLLLPALLMAYMAYEAFVNFAGYAVLPDLWADERENFKGQGTEGKLKRIVAEIPQFKWTKGQKPYQAVKRLEDFRNMVAHGKVLASDYVVPALPNGTHIRFSHAWDSYLTFAAVKDSRAAIEQFCQSLVLELRNICEHPHLIHDAFQGSLGSARTSSDS